MRAALRRSGRTAGAVPGGLARQCVTIRGEGVPAASCYCSGDRDLKQQEEPEGGGMKHATLLCAACALLIGPFASASAQDTLKLTIGQRGNWDTSVSEV